MNKQDCILFSGGAKGSEAAFGAIAEEHGIEEVNFSFEGHSIERQRGLRVLNHEELLRGGCQPGICVSSDEPALYRNSNIEKTAPEHLVSSQQRSGDLRHR